MNKVNTTEEKEHERPATDRSDEETYQAAENAILMPDPNAKRDADADDNHEGGQVNWRHGPVSRLRSITNESNFAQRCNSIRCLIIPIKNFGFYGVPGDRHGCFVGFRVFWAAFGDRRTAFRDSLSAMIWIDES